MKKSKKKKQKMKAAQLPGSTVKMSFRRHVLPPLVGFGAMLAVLGLFNSQFIAAKLYTLTYDQPAQTDTVTSESAPVDPASKNLTIEDIGVAAPVVYGQQSINEANFQLALRDGVVHYPNTAKPGSPGNAVIFGHSSGQVWAPGNYKFVFMRLEKLSVGRRITIENEGVRYIYRVTEKKIVSPNEVSVLAQDPSKYTLTLITCTPVGTNKNRLIVTAEQIVPIPPKGEQTAPDKQPLTEIEELPGTQNPSFWESLRNRF